ncbi:uncharacterized protein I303_104026 [Kwoniella dejecticola CBS 10117]|uniref:U3 small nucleolar RNA-associated protein 18 n=1 Tax=Kwoniella dejecticola CBS 10117 TaxID=1296121 RepID=A0A1A6A8E1_9TREE|nr:uncharacterized protein I303_04045 [Kwoniella dejecticola CBS 10117]OBR86321.1 hypothetical protein I303_04045 [Kwoniella dejecticola CBS 10117]
MAQKKRRSRPSDLEIQNRPTEITHDWEKSEEELELEASLFGADKTKSKKKSKTKGLIAGFVLDNQGESDGEAGLSDLEDNDLFTIDAPIAENYDADNLPDDQVSSEDEVDDGESSSSGSASGSENEFRAASPSSSRSSSPAQGLEDDKDRPTIVLPDDIYDVDVEQEKLKGKKKAIWTDPSDDLISVDPSENRRLRKLDRGKKRKLNAQGQGQGEGEAVGGRELQERLREQFERLHPPPEWARNRTAIGTPSLSSLLTSTKSFIAPTVSGSSRSALPQGHMDLQRMRNANQQNPTTGKREAANAGGGVVDFAWHPSERVGVMAVAGGDRRVRFFNIDGHTNPTLMTLHIPSLPLSRSTFHPSGSSLLLVGNRPYYYTYDLAAQRCLRSPKNLFGSMDTPSSPNSLHRHSFSPDGTLLAVAGRRGAISILDWSSGGAGGVVAELRSGRGGTSTDLLWSPNGRELSVLGGRDGAEIEVWDVAERRIKSKWRDDRALGGTILRSSKDGKYTAIGSRTGIVNLYDSTSLIPSQPAKKYSEIQPEPYKSLEQLTMSINCLSFHPSNEVLVTASEGRKDLLKMYHLPSGTAFSNWPTANTPLGRITSTGFSPSGEYLSVGNQRGTVLLWSLRHYAL